MNCPHCGWNLKVTREWVAQDGYHAEFECRYATCEVKVSANTNLFWAYENNKIKINSISAWKTRKISNSQYPE